MKGRLHFIEQDLTGAWLGAFRIVAALQFERLLRSHARFIEMYGP